MKTLCQSVRGAIVLALLTGSACTFAQNTNPNGFPSGPHYNLNIIGKKADFTCTPTQPDPITGLYGNVVFIPEIGLSENSGQIVITSGKKGGKATSQWSTELQVTDACSPAFDGTPAVVQLPPSEKGYWVYARALAKPVEDSFWGISYNGLISAQDEFGNDLVALGLVTSDGVAKSGETLQRSKGKSTALDITQLFMWTGTICTIDYSQYLLLDPLDPINYRPLCWTDGGLDTLPDGLLTDDDTFAQPGTDPANPCTTGSKLIWVRVACASYSTDPVWIFNIAELVSADWLVDNNGTKLVQIRFYPVQ